MSTDMSAEYRSIYRPRVSTDTRLTDAVSTHDPYAANKIIFLFVLRIKQKWLEREICLLLFKIKMRHFKVLTFEWDNATALNSKHSCLSLELRKYNFLSRPQLFVSGCFRPQTWIVVCLTLSVKWRIYTWLISVQLNFPFYLVQNHKT